MNGKVLHLGDPGECKQFLDRISPQLHHLVAVQWNTLRYLRYTGRNLFDVPHPLQRQRYHLLDRDPQWHNVFLSKKNHQNSMATKGKGAQENSIFAGKEQGHHAPAELLVEPPRKCLSSPTQGHLSMVSQPLRNLPTHTFHSAIVIIPNHTCHKPPFWCPLLSAVPETLLYHRIPKKLCDIVTRLHGPLSSVTAVWSAFEKKKRVGADPSHSSTSDNNPRIKGDGGPSAFTAAKNWDFTAVGEASSIQRP